MNVENFIVVSETKPVRGAGYPRRDHQGVMNCSDKGSIFEKPGKLILR